MIKIRFSFPRFFIYKFKHNFLFYGSRTYYTNEYSVFHISNVSRLLFGPFVNKVISLFPSHAHKNMPRKREGYFLCFNLKNPSFYKCIYFLHKEQYKSSFYSAPFSFILWNIFFVVYCRLIYTNACTRTERT